MLSTLTSLLNLLDENISNSSPVIKWCCPVVSFGDTSTAEVATLGLNPSDREFLDRGGKELSGTERRFHTLRSLGLTSWAEVDAMHLDLILDSCKNYFLGNPYDRWFKQMDKVIADTEASFYAEEGSACHLDLVPFATNRRWADLTSKEQDQLVLASGSFLGKLLRDSHIKLLILNGRTVVNHFQKISGVSLIERAMPSWSLKRSNKRDVPGFSFAGRVGAINGIELGTSILVLGYNHNIQSSFGVTADVVRNIGQWIGQELERTQT